MNVENLKLKKLNKVPYKAIKESMNGINKINMEFLIIFTLL